MKKIDKKKLIILYAIGVLLVGGCLFVFKILEADTAKLVLTSFCNSFFVVGGILMFLGLAIWCANHGAFVGLTYSWKRIFEKRRSEKAFQKRQKYSEYRESRLAKQKEFLHFIVVGVSFILISLVFLLFI